MGLKVAIVGAGPAGLYLAYLLRQGEAHHVEVLEQNPADATYGFGVVFTERALHFLNDGSPELVRRIGDATEIWSGQDIALCGKNVRLDGGRAFAIERLKLLQILQEQCVDAGARIAFDTRIESMDSLAGFDVIVAADGTNSVVRNAYADAFGPKLQEYSNRFAWYGTSTFYEVNALTFLRTEHGAFCGHHYRYRPGMSTFVPECDEAAWHGHGMAAMSGDERRRLSEEIFASVLDGPLISNGSTWNPWRITSNEHWNHENIVLIGDACRTAHPSIGAGTRLAMEDSIFLWRALEEGGDDVPRALAAYEAERRPIREKLNRAAELSIDWYVRMGEHMDLPPHDFVYSFLTRTERMTPERLGRELPGFMRDYNNQRTAAQSAA